MGCCIEKAPVGILARGVIGPCADSIHSHKLIKIDHFLSLSFETISVRIEFAIVRHKLNRNNATLCSVRIRN